MLGHLVCQFTWAVALATPTGESVDLVDSLNYLIETHYVEESKIPEITNNLDTLRSNTDALITVNPTELAQQLTSVLQAHDRHFTVEYLAPEQAQEKPIKIPWFTRLAQQNYGFNSLRVLENNVGVMAFWGFAQLTPKAKEKVANVMAFFSDVDALIIDLRENGGGSGEMVQWLSSYFIDGPVHLNSFYTRATQTLQHFSTVDEINDDHLEAIPLYILIGSDTFSAAEEFAYNFKYLGRATLIGEPSKGGANPWRWFSLNAQFRVGIPVTKAINPVTQTNWESVGVQPHIHTKGNNALDVAYQQALKQLTGSHQ